MDQRGPRCPRLEPGEPTEPGEQSGNPQRGEKTPWSFTAACRWGMAVVAECSREPSIPFSSGSGGGDNVTPTFRGYVSDRGESSGTTVGGQFGWGGTPLKRYRGGPKVGSGGTETRRRGQGQKPA